MIRFAARNKPKAVVDMIPMIDIVFQLVIFFMVATTFKTTTGMELNIPNAKKVSNVPTSTLQVYIRNRSDIKVGDIQTDMSHFEQNLPAVGNDKKKRNYLWQQRCGIPTADRYNGHPAAEQL